MPDRFVCAWATSPVLGPTGTPSGRLPAQWVIQLQLAVTLWRDMLTPMQMRCHTCGARSYVQ
jgi:hypothetical protein